MCLNLSEYYGELTSKAAAALAIPGSKRNWKPLSLQLASESHPLGSDPVIRMLPLILWLERITIKRYRSKVSLALKNLPEMQRGWSLGQKIPRGGIGNPLNRKYLICKQRREAQERAESLSFNNKDHISSFSFSQAFRIATVGTHYDSAECVMVLLISLDNDL